jgi:hypothetical protein
MPTIPVLRKLRQKNFEFEAKRSCHKTKKQTKTKRDK